MSITASLSASRPSADSRVSSTVLRLLGAYLALSVAAVGALFVMRAGHTAVSSATWTHGVIVAASSLLTFSFGLRVAGGSARALLRLRIATAVMLVAILVISALPGSFPLWMKIQEGVCGLLLVGVVAMINGLRRAG